MGWIGFILIALSFLQQLLLGRPELKLSFTRILYSKRTEPDASNAGEQSLRGLAGGAVQAADGEVSSDKKWSGAHTRRMSWRGSRLRPVEIR